MRLRTATPSDAPLLRHRDDQPHVIAAAPNEVWDWDAELKHSPPWRELLIAEHEGRPIGFLQIIDPAVEETHYWGEVEADLRAIDIWIGEAEDLGKGFGTAMMKLAFERCFVDPAVNGILIDPLAGNVRAHRFYERLGFRFVERRSFDEDDCFVYRLDRPDRGRPASGIH